MAAVVVHKLTISRVNGSVLECHPLNARADTVEVSVADAQWLDGLTLAVGMRVNVISANGTLTVGHHDDDTNMLIVQPDLLLSVTTVAAAFGCLRRAVLTD